MTRARPGIVSLFAIATCACPRTEPSVTPGQNPSAVEPAQADPPVDPDPAPDGVCGTPAQRFADYDWVPDDSRLTTSILRDDPELPAALTTLAQMVESDAVQLPIRAALDYENLGLQLLGLEGVIATIELDPGELVELHSPDGDVVWLWPSNCPTATLATRMLARFEVLVRADFEHPGLRLGSGSTRFPFDLVLMHERLVALAPLGRGAHVGAWLSAPRHDEDGPGVALASIDHAPIRSVLSGPSLLAGDHDDVSSTAHHRKLRATATTWHEGWHEGDPAL